jgi:hypothetical protein
MTHGYSLNLINGEDIFAELTGSSISNAAGRVGKNFNTAWAAIRPCSTNT